MKNMKVVALIPARSGSKSVKDKNIRIMNGKPMIAYSIESALQSNYIESAVVSTDSPQYAEIAKCYGAEIPFLRPSDISGDHSLDIEVFEHYLSWLQANNIDLPEAIVHLRPTHPIRDVRDIDNMIELLLKNKDVDAIRSVSPAKQVPYKMWLFEGEREMKPLVECSVKEAYNAPRQILPEVYMQNACIDVLRTRTILDKHSMTGDKIWGYKMDYDFDIDTESDFLLTEQYMTILQKMKTGKKIKICCDIDGVIAGKTADNNYKNAVPMNANIELLRKLEAKGHEIVLYTARGYATGIDWKEVTETQMEQWRVPASKIVFGKPDADFYVDDKLVSLEFLAKICK